MRLGVRAHDFGKRPLDELAGQIAAHGFCGVQFAPTKAIAGYDDDVGRLSPGLAGFARETFQRHGIHIAVLGCYINLGDPEEGRKRPQMERFKDYLRHARDFGCSVVGTETGSVNADYSFHPDNHGEKAFQTVLVSMRELVREAEKFGVCVGLEGVERYVIESPRRLKRIVDEVDSGNLQIILDPVNLLNIGNHHDQRAIMEESFALLAPRIGIMHVKDFVVADGQFRSVPAGQGQLDLALLCRLIKQHKPWIDILLEDTQPATVAQSVAHVKAAFAKA